MGVMNVIINFSWSNSMEERELVNRTELIIFTDRKLKPVLYNETMQNTHTVFLNKNK